MSASKTLTVASPIIATTAFIPFLTQLSEEDSDSQIPQELRDKKDLCWGFRIEQTGNDESNNDEGMLKAKLSKFGFWRPKDKVCHQDGLNSMEEASQDTTNTVNSWCEKHNVVSKKWGRRALQEAPIQITEADKNAWRLVAFLECIKLVKTLTLKSTGEEGLKHSVIGQF